MSSMHRLIARAAPVLPAVVAGMMLPPNAAAADDAPIKASGGSGVHIGSRMCAFAGRTDWALREFGLSREFQRVEIPLGGSRPTWLRHINPENTVPVIIDDAGQRVQGNSAALAEWLLQKSGAQASPEGVLRVVRDFDRKVTGTLYAMLRCTAPPKSPEWDRARYRVESMLAAVEEEFASSSTDGPYFLGSELSLADIAIISVLYRFQASLREFRDYELITPERTPCLARALAACASRPAFREATPTDFEIVKFYQTDEVYNPNSRSEALDTWVTRMLAGLQPAP